VERLGYTFLNNKVEYNAKCQNSKYLIHILFTWHSYTKPSWLSGISNIKSCPQLLSSKRESLCYSRPPQGWKRLHSTGLRYTNTLEKIQRRAARFVKHDCRYNSSPANIVTKLGWSYLQERRKNLFHYSCSKSSTIKLLFRPEIVYIRHSTLISHVSVSPNSPSVRSLFLIWSIEYGH